MSLISNDTKYHTISIWPFPIHTYYYETLSTHFYRLQPHSISCPFKTEKTKYIMVRRRLSYDKCVITHTRNSVIKEFKIHTCLLPHKFMRITCNKCRNFSEIQYTCNKLWFDYIQTKYSKPANTPDHTSDSAHFVTKYSRVSNWVPEGAHKPGPPWPPAQLPSATGLFP